MLHALAQVKTALITDTLKALHQTSADKAAYMEQESKALAQRLYAPAACALPIRRPLSGLPRRRQLHVSGWAAGPPTAVHSC